MEKCESHKSKVESLFVSAKVIILLFTIWIWLSAGLCNAVELQTSAESHTETRDIYDAINILVDSLQIWAANLNALTNSQHTEKNIDSLSLTEFFPRYAFTEIDSAGVIEISLPPYMDLLTTVLILDQNSPETRWTTPVEWDGEHLMVDNIPIPVSGQILPDSVLIDHIRKNITMLRTLGLPEILHYKCNMEDSLQVIVTVRGREIIDIPFRLTTWMGSLSKLTFGKQLYAGLMNAMVDSSIASLNYYILITYPGINGHHFLEWRERLNKTDDSWRTNEITIMFSPYIRTDNLKNLFAKPKDTGREPMELRINR